MNDSGIEILLSSDCDYEKLTAEIFFNGKFIALINQDEGFEHLKIEFPASDIEESEVIRNIDLNVFERALSLAKEKLQG